MIIPIILCLLHKKNLQGGQLRFHLSFIRDILIIKEPSYCIQQLQYILMKLKPQQLKIIITLTIFYNFIPILKISNENNNWVLFAIRPILKMLINTGGLTIGPSFYRIRPQNIVYKCFHCQQFGHLSHFCQNSIHSAIIAVWSIFSIIAQIYPAELTTSHPTIYIKPVITRLINPLSLIALVNLYILTKHLIWITIFCKQLIFKISSDFKILLFKMILSLNILSFHYRGL